MYWFEAAMIILGFGLWAYFIYNDTKKAKKPCKCKEGGCNQKQ